MSIYIPESADISGLDASFWKKKKKPAPAVKLSDKLMKVKTSAEQSMFSTKAIRMTTEQRCIAIGGRWDSSTNKCFKRVCNSADITLPQPVDPYAQAKADCAAKGGQWYPFANPQKCFKRVCNEADAGF